MLHATTLLENDFDLSLPGYVTSVYEYANYKLDMKRSFYREEEIR